MSRHKNKIRRPSISSHGKTESAQIRTNENVCVSIPSKSQRKFFFISIRICFFLYMLWFWAFHCRDFIFMAQEYDLFIWDWEYLIYAGSRVTGLARWFSSFTLQFFYYPVVGGILLAVCMSFLQYSHFLFSSRQATDGHHLVGLPALQGSFSVCSDIA